MTRRYADPGCFVRMLAVLAGAWIWLNARRWERGPNRGKGTTCSGARPARLSTT